MKQPKYTLDCADERVWYDQHYAAVQKDVPPWYRFMMPDLAQEARPGKKLVELGVGQGHGLRHLVQQYQFPEENIWAIDHSEVAVNFVKQFLPKAHLEACSIYDLNYPAEFFDIVLFMATIEHLEEPEQALKLIYHCTKTGGALYLTFPNYLNFPWLMVRILAEKLKKPNWIVLQPIDKIYSVFGINRMLAAGGFLWEKCIGTPYFPPILYKYEP